MTILVRICDTFFQTSISKPGDAESIGLAVVNTIIGGSAGGLTVLFYNKFILGQKWSYLMSLNGALTGTAFLTTCFFIF